jgi:hypothetical protein
MFDLSNNANHVGLRMTIPLEQIVAPLQKVNEMDGEIITLAQVLVEELIVAFEGDDDEHDGKDIPSFGSKNNLFS